MGTVALRSSSGWSYPVLSAGALSGALAVHEAGPAGAPKPRLLDRVREAIRTRHYSRSTEKAYVQVAASTQNQALSALLFLYREVLGVELPWLDDVVRAKRPCTSPSC